MSSPQREKSLPRKRRRAIVAGRFVVDPALLNLAYRCYPDGCPRGRTCCTDLTVEVSKREVRAIDSIMDVLARRLPGLRDRDGYANVFVEEPPGLLIEACDDGSCPFLFRTRRHSLCAVHKAALDGGTPVPALKPAACRHWPITLEGAGERVRLTFQKTALTIGCVAPADELPGKPRLWEAFRAEIAEICGPELVAVLARAARRLHSPTRA